jgi:hypothetical protein
MATMEWIDRAEAFLPSSASGESCEGRRDVYIAYMVRVRGTASRARSPNNNRQEKYAAVEYTLSFCFCAFVVRRHMHGRIDLPLLWKKDGQSRG